MLSAEGGVEIEQVADENPDAIAKIHVDPGRRAHRHAGREWVDAAGLDPEATRRARSTSSRSCARCYVDADADLVEINPLILTPDGRVHALDAKVTLDDNSVFRHPEYAEYDETQVRDTRETRSATRRGSSTSASTATSASSPTAPGSR